MLIDKLSAVKSADCHLVYTVAPFLVPKMKAHNENALSPLLKYKSYVDIISVKIISF